MESPAGGGSGAADGDGQVVARGCAGGADVRGGFPPVHAPRSARAHELNRSMCADNARPWPVTRHSRCRLRPIEGNDVARILRIPWPHWFVNVGWGGPDLSGCKRDASGQLLNVTARAGECNHGAAGVLELAEIPPTSAPVLVGRSRRGREFPHPPLAIIPRPVSIRQRSPRGNVGFSRRDDLLGSWRAAGVGARSQASALARAGRRGGGTPAVGDPPDPGAEQPSGARNLPPVSRSCSRNVPPRDCETPRRGEACVSGWALSSSPTSRCRR